MKKKVKRLNITPIHTVEFEELNNAQVVFNHATNSVNKFYELFQKRKSGVGSTTHADQDLLRAMLVFSCSGLDAVLKQLIKDALPVVIDKELGAQKEFQKFIERRIKKGSLSDEREKIAIDTNWIASVFASSRPRNYLMETLQKTLTDDSLQSRDQLLKIAAHFAITQADVLHDTENTKKAFDVRNEIIHEMDTNLSGRKKRRQRSAPVMITYCENILSVGARFINTVHKKISDHPNFSK